MQRQIQGFWLVFQKYIINMYFTIFKCVFQIPNAYYSSNALGYQNIWYSYGGQPAYQYPQQGRVQPQATSYKYVSYYPYLQYNQNYQYRSINAYPPPQQLPFDPVENDPYAENPHVARLTPPQTYAHANYAPVTNKYVHQQGMSYSFHFFFPDLFKCKFSPILQILPNSVVFGKNLGLNT